MTTKMVKIVSNGCYGGFSLSRKAYEMYCELKGIAPEPREERRIFDSYGRGIERSDPDLIRVIEALGEEANGRCAALDITEIPEGTKYRIDEYDGYEQVMTIDDYEWSVA